MENLENELKFLINKFPDDYKKSPSVEITQGYISFSPSPLRVRRTNDEYELTKKFPAVLGDRSRKIEKTVELKKEEFDRIFSVCLNSLSKTRYKYRIASNLIAEIDVFHGKLEGFACVEVEFPSEAARESFKKPSWFGRDITHERWSGNAELAKVTYKELQKLIS